MQVDQAKVQQKSAEFLSAMSGLEHNPDWKLKKQKEVKVWNMDIDKRTAIRAETIIHVPFQQTVSFFKDLDNMKILQDNLIKIETPYSNGNIKILHMVVKMPTPVSNRQTVCVNTVKEEGKKVIIGNISGDFPVDLDKDAELGHVYVAGFIIEQIQEGKTRVVYISDMDPRGHIPQPISNLLAGKRAQVLYKLQEKMVVLQKLTM